MCHAITQWVGNMLLLNASPPPPNAMIDGLLFKVLVTGGLCQLTGLCSVWMLVGLLSLSSSLKNGGECLKEGMKGFSERGFKDDREETGRWNMQDCAKPVHVLGVC